MGIANACVNIYLGELSIVRLRGFAGGLNPMMLMIACSIALTLNTFLPLSALLKVCAAPSAVFLVLCALLAESPVWLVKKGRQGEAAKALQWLRGKEYPVKVILLIKLISFHSAKLIACGSEKPEILSLCSYIFRFFI